MANTLELTDGSTTHNLYNGSDWSVLSLALSPLRRATGAVPDGSDLGMEPREIMIGLRIYGTSKADLLTNMRAIQQMCENARQRWEERKVNAAVALVQLNTQFGTTASVDTVWDVIEATATPPRDWFDVHATETLFSLGTKADPYMVRLLVRPYGIGPEQSPAGDTLENEQDSPLLNYQDITGVLGDAPARFRLKLVVAGETGTKTLWVARRSGARYNNTLWRQGESYDSATTGGSYAQTASTQADAAQSDGNVARVREDLAEGAQADEVKGYLSYTLTGAPRGLFRVLIMQKAVVTGTPSATNMKFGLGYDFGSLVSTPALADMQFSLGTSYRMLDLGVLRILPTSEPPGGTLSAFNLRIYLGFDGTNSTNINNREQDWFVDYVQLVPIDEGMAAITHVAADDVLLDTYGEPSGVYQLDAGTGAVEDLPAHDGSAFDLMPGNNRIYVIRDDVKGATFATTPTYKPRFAAL